jgi:hypothetical protein
MLFDKLNIDFIGNYMQFIYKENLYSTITFSSIDHGKCFYDKNPQVKGTILAQVFLEIRSINLRGPPRSRISSLIKSRGFLIMNIKLPDYSPQSTYIFYTRCSLKGAQA